MKITFKIKALKGNSIADTVNNTLFDICLYDTIPSEAHRGASDDVYTDIKSLRGGDRILSYWVDMSSYVIGGAKVLDNYLSLAINHIREERLSSILS